MIVTRHIIVLLLISNLCACKSKTTEKTDTQEQNPSGTYFSIKQFAEDQWNVFHGQPFSFDKVVKMNGKTDSTLVSAFNIEWGAIFKIFFETDISDKKFLGQYDFNMFEDNTTGTRNFYYEAKDKKLYTRTLQITADLFTNKVRYIYIETEKKSFWAHHVQKLYYAPLKVIQIQEFEDAAFSKGKELRIEYRFLQ